MVEELKETGNFADAIDINDREGDPVDDNIEQETGGDNSGSDNQEVDIEFLEDGNFHDLISDGFLRDPVNDGIHEELKVDIRVANDKIESFDFEKHDDLKNDNLEWRGL